MAAGKTDPVEGTMQLQIPSIGTRNNVITCSDCSLHSLCLPHSATLSITFLLLASR